MVKKIKAPKSQLIAPTNTPQEIDAMNFEAWELRDDDPQQAFSLGTQAHQQSSSPMPYSKGIAQSLSTLGDRLRKIEGPGLGLAITRTLIEMMESELNVQSIPNQGTIFSFNLILPQVSNGIRPDTLPARKIIGVKNASPKILIADDTTENRIFLRHLLLPLGFSIQEASTGQDALKQAAQFAPDIIILDLIMPEMDGLELTCRIRQTPTHKDTVIFAVSASAFAEDEQASLQAGCDAFMSKPVDIKFMFELLQQHLNLEWIYAEDIENNLKQEKLKLSMHTNLVIPPKTELEILYEIAKIGDIIEFEEQAHQLADQFESFSLEMGRLAKGFQINKICKRLDFI